MKKSFELSSMLNGIDLWTAAFLMASASLCVILYYLIRLSVNLRKYMPLVVFVFLALVELLVDSAISIKPEAFVHLLYVTEPFAMLYGVLIYLYARNHASQNLQFRKEDLLFLIPFVLSVMSYLPFYVLSAQEKLADFMAFGNLKSDVSENIWEWNFEVVLNISFLFAALKQLNRYNFKIKAQLSDIHRVQLNLTHWLIKVCMLSYFVELVFVYLTYFGFPYYQALFTVFSLINYLVLLMIGYEAIISRKYIDELSSGWVVANVKEVEVSGEVIKYAKSTLNHESAQKIKEDLLKYMEENKPFLQPQLRIKDLSELTHISTHHISQVINEAFHQNFYEFVNSYRIDEAKRLLKDSNFKNYTYTAIGFEVGFNSKSAFYTAFKKFTGCSPANY